MKRTLCLTAVVLLAAAAASAQAPGGQRVGVAARLQQGYNQLKTNLTQSADKMSDADASFKPAPALDASATKR